MERFLIEHCSPTLAGLKAGSLFPCGCKEKEALFFELDEMNRRLNAKGVRLRLIHLREGRALVYVYRRQGLEKELRREKTAAFLRGYGYEPASAERCVDRLAERCHTCGTFPHEIGVFLGYPLEDVIGFINNAGENSKCSGCWKVYGDEEGALRLFERYEKCRRVYRRLFQQGRSLLKLTVAA